MFFGKQTWRLAVHSLTQGRSQGNLDRLFLRKYSYFLGRMWWIRTPQKWNTKSETKSPHRTCVALVFNAEQELATKKRKKGKKTPKNKTKCVKKKLCWFSIKKKQCMSTGSHVTRQAPTHGQEKAERKWYSFLWWTICETASLTRPSFQKKNHYSLPGKPERQEGRERLTPCRKGHTLHDSFTQVMPVKYLLLSNWWKLSKNTQNLFLQKEAKTSYIALQRKKKKLSSVINVFNHAFHSLQAGKKGCRYFRLYCVYAQQEPISAGGSRVPEAESDQTCHISPRGTLMDGILFWAVVDSSQT